MSQRSTGGSSAHRADDPFDRTNAEPLASTSGGQSGGGRKDAAKDAGKQVAGSAKESGKQVAGSAQEAGKQVAGSAQEAGKQVAGTAKDKAGDVGQEAKHQAKDLLSEGRSQLNQHAGEQQRRAAQGLSSLTDELRGMVNGEPQEGPVTDLVRQAGDRVEEVQRWIGEREPADLLDDVRHFAARRPGTFLAIAAGAGLLAGRFGRGLKDAGSDSGAGSSSRGTSTSGTTSTSGATYGTAATGTAATGTRLPADGTGTAGVSFEDRTAPGGSPRGTAL